MNAVVKNKSEAELIKLCFEVSNLLGLDIDLEFEALKEGGIKDFLKYFNKKKNREKVGKWLFYFGAILSGVLTNVLSDYFNKDVELDELTKEEKRLNIQKLKKDLENDSVSEVDSTIIVESLIIQICDTHKVQVFKSRFYQQLLKEPKLYQFSTTVLDLNYNPTSIERKISRLDFAQQILDNEDLKPQTIENANIEIVSPVLKQGNIKWKGIFNGKPISFVLSDTEFKNAVLNKRYSFTNGTSIKCTVEIIVTLNDEGDEVIKESKVFDVLEVFDGTQSHITKRSKHFKELKNQMKIDFNK